MELNSSLKHNPIAIVGLGTLAPQATNAREFWDNIVRKVDAITDVPLSRWDINDYYDPDPTQPDKTYCKRGGFLPDVDFDPVEFGLPPNILEVTDVSQLLSLMVAKQALADAGYGDGRNFPRERTGVILGVGGGQKLITPLTSRLQYPVWEKVLRASGLSEADTQRVIEKMKLAYIPWEENSFPGMLGNVIAGRIANRLDLGGINCVVDAACASSLAALKMALSELTEGRAEMMLAGGVDTDNSIFMYMSFSKTPAFSKSNKIRPFDAESDGMMIGEAVAMVVLKRLADAERDGDRIYAVIRGIGTSSDGRYKSIYAPRDEGQMLALRRAYDDAGFTPNTVTLIEAHGTGTLAGDATEFAALNDVFSEHHPGKQAIALGSIKSQIGHTKSAAGAVSLAKVALALHHKVLPPTIGVTQPNPKFNIETTPFYINTEARPWLTENGMPRRAGVSSFGFGGTNYHVVLEEYMPEQETAYRLHHTAQVIVIAAPTPQQLLARSREIIESLNSSTHFYNQLVEHSKALQPSTDEARLGFVAGDAAEAVELLTLGSETLAKDLQKEAFTHPKGVYYRRSAVDTDGAVVALFAGQGSQYVEMGRELANNFPIVRSALTYTDSLFAADGLNTLSETIYPAPAFDKDAKLIQTENLQRTDHAQPAIGSLSAGMFWILQGAGFAPNFTAGHSFGELSALWAAGAISTEDYFMLIKARGKAMAPPPGVAHFDAGAMLAIQGDLSHLEHDLAAFPGLSIANWNSPKQVVVAGPREAIANAHPALQAKGYTVNALPVAAAFHTTLVGHAQEAFWEALQQATFYTPAIPVYANQTGDVYPDDPEAIREMLGQQLLNPVQFTIEIENIYAAGGRVFVEFGPRNILSNLVSDILGDRPHLAIALNPSRQKDSDRQLREAVAQLRVLGLSLGDIDPYHLPPAPPAPKKEKSLSVKLNGANYVSPKTQKAYQDALNDGFRVASGAAIQPVHSTESTTEDDMNTQQLLQSLERSLAQFGAQQAEIMRAHEQYLNAQAEYARIFFDLMQQQQNLLLNSQSLPAGALESVSQNMARFHDQQAHTLRVHEQYLNEQAHQSQTFLDLLRQEIAAITGGQAVVSAPARPAATAPRPAAPAPAARPPVPAPAARPTPPAPAARPAPVAARPAAPAPAPRPAAPAPAPRPAAPKPAPQPVAAVQPAPVAAKPSNGVSDAALSKALLDIVSEKTGYPADMLDLSMDIEADLGIDSIKRVEILGAMRNQFPGLPQPKPEELAQLRTLGQIADYMNVGGGSAPSAAPVAVAAPAPAPVAVGGAQLEVLSSSLLDIVSEKTGYPADMLDLSMDIEADLGIDSIKRVEILGAMRNQYPELPQPKPEELAQLRTLGEIVNYLGANGKKK